MQLFQEFEKRRRELGMSRSMLARRSRVSLPTLNRIMSSQDGRAAFAHVAAIARALGMDLTPVVKVGSEDLRRKQATSKARRLVRLVQGTSGLEGQAVDQQDLESMVARTTEQLLRSNRKLWSE
jgi:transcriptional regulator with XRE-family HTH domain